MLIVPRTGSNIWHQQHASEMNGEIKSNKEKGIDELDLPEGFDPEIHELCADEDGTYYVLIDHKKEAS